MGNKKGTDGKINPVSVAKTQLWYYDYIMVQEESSLENEQSMYGISAIREKFLVGEVLK